MGGSSSKVKKSSTNYANGTGNKPLENNDDTEQQCALESIILHTEAIQSLCVASEGELFSGGVDKEVILYSWTRHTPRARFKGPSKDITKIVYNNKRGVVYAASRDRFIYAWNWPEDDADSQTVQDKGRVCCRLIEEPSLTLQGHSLGVTGLASNDAYPQLLCSGSRDNSVALWDVNTGKSVSSMHAPRNLVTGIEWIEGEKAVVQSSEDKTLRVWDLRSCSTVQHFRARNYLQTCCAVSEDRQQFVAGSSGSGHGAMLTLWDRRNERKPIEEFKGHTECVTDCIFLTIKDRQIIGSVGSESTLRLWNKETGDCLHSEYLSDAGPLTSTVSPSPGIIACSSFKGGVSLWTVGSDISDSNNSLLSLSLRSKY